MRISLPVRKRRQRLQAEVDADPLIGCLAGTLQLDWKVDVPSTASVLVEASGSNPDGGRKNIAQVHRLVSDAMETERLTVERDVAGVERHPAERVAVTEAEPPLLLLLAGFYILLAHPLNRVGMQIEFDAGTCCRPRQAPVSQPLLFPSPPRFEGVPPCLVAVIPDAIDRPRLPVQFGIAETKLYGQLLHCLPGDSTYDIKMQLCSLQA